VTVAPPPACAKGNAGRAASRAVDIGGLIPYPSGVDSWSLAIDAVERCLRAGIREFVICGGARNAALIEALARAEAAGHARLWRHFEERGAGFFALGRTLATGLPCAVATTSGTAAAELLPAMIEARYQSRPLVALTADRPATHRGRGTPQAIDQLHLFGGCAFDGGLDAWDGLGPLHWNLGFEETFETGNEFFQDLRPGVFDAGWGAPDVAALARWLRGGPAEGIAVMLGGLEPSEREEVFHFCRELGAPVAAEATSGLREALQGLVLHDADRVLRAHAPRKILRLGDVPSGRFWRDLETMTGTEVWSVCRNGLPGLAREAKVTRGPADRVIRALGAIDPAGDALDLLESNATRADRITELLERHPDSEASMVRMLSNYASLGSGVFLGNSLPIREWNLFAQSRRPVMNVRANRGANGIDGQLATWLGWSADSAASWAVVGDLTALYDIASPLMLHQIVAEGRVLVVIHNRGGRIFDRLPRLRGMSPRAIECLTQPHDADLSVLARFWGMDHLRVATADEFDRFDPAAAGAVLLELAPDADQTAAFWSDWDRMDDGA